MKSYFLLLFILTMTFFRSSESCHYQCATCSGGELETNCDTCDSGTNHRKAEGTKCICDADDDGSSALCATCDKRCKTCNGAGENACQSCNTDISLTGTAPCACKCTDTTKYLDPDGTCKDCHYSCLTCSADGISGCLSTTNHRKTDGTKCICDDKYYDDNTNALCAGCPTECATCTAAATCTACVDGYYKTDDSCTAGENACQSCNTGIQLTGTASCSSICTDTTKYLDSDGVCQSCYYLCLTCSVETDACSTCTSCICSTNYTDKSQPLCEPDCQCHYTCMTGTCTFNRVYNQYRKKCICEEGYYDNELYTEGNGLFNFLFWLGCSIILLLLLFFYWLTIKFLSNLMELLMELGFGLLIDLIDFGINNKIIFFFF